MNEAEEKRRGWYLANLGVAQYIHRETSRALPDGALYPEPAVREKPALPPVAEGGMPRAIIDTIASEIEDVLAPESKPGAIPEAQPGLPVDAGSTESDSGEPEPAGFRLACWQPTEDLLIIDNLAEANLSQPQQRLLANILVAIQNLRHQAMGGDMPVEPVGSRPDLAVETLDWSGETGDGSRAGDVAMLAAFIEGRVKKRGVCRVLLMGEQVATLLGDYISDEGVCRLPGGARACTAPSLAAMLENPAGKITAWRAIQALF